MTDISMHYVETRPDGGLRIANKRVDILNCDAAFGNIQLLL